MQTAIIEVREKLEFVVQWYYKLMPIGIGTPITERPSHTTGHTGHVSGAGKGGPGPCQTAVSANDLCMLVDGCGGT